MRTIAIAFALLISTAHAGDHKFTAWAGAGAWNDDTTPWHGAVILAYELDELPLESKFSAVLNTETLKVAWRDLRVADRLWVNFTLGGEAYVAGVLRDYYRDGMNTEERGFWASYLVASATVKARLTDRTWLELELTGRRWFLENRADTTQRELTLANDPYMFEPRLHYTWWNLADDAGWRDLNRPFPRMRGVAFGATLGFDIRSVTNPWGARDATAFEPVDLRNDPEQLTIHGRQWLKAGWQIAPWVRTQLDQSAGIVNGGDDLVRPRIGGLNPYVVPLFGAPWASWLPDAYLGGLWSWHFRAVEGLELGPAATLVVLNDPHRISDEDDVDALWGVGAVADWRSGGWQVDLRGGWSPSVEDFSGELGWNVWLSGGWTGGF